MEAHTNPDKTTTFNVTQDFSYKDIVKFETHNVGDKQLFQELIYKMINQLPKDKLMQLFNANKEDLKLHGQRFEISVII